MPAKRKAAKPVEAVAAGTVDAPKSKRIRKPSAVAQGASAEGNKPKSVKGKGKGKAKGKGKGKGKRSKAKVSAGDEDDESEGDTKASDSEGDGSVSDEDSDDVSGHTGSDGAPPALLRCPSSLPIALQHTKSVSPNALSVVHASAGMGKTRFLKLIHALIAHADPLVSAAAVASAAATEAERKRQRNPKSAAATEEATTSSGGAASSAAIGVYATPVVGVVPHWDDNRCACGGNPHVTALCEEVWTALEHTTVHPFSGVATRAASSSSSSSRTPLVSPQQRFREYVSRSVVASIDLNEDATQELANVRSGAAQFALRVLFNTWAQKGVSRFRDSHPRGYVVLDLLNRATEHEILSAMCTVLHLTRRSFRLYTTTTPVETPQYPLLSRLTSALLDLRHEIVEANPKQWLRPKPRTARDGAKALGKPLPNHRVTKPSGVVIEDQFARNKHQLRENAQWVFRGAVAGRRDQLLAEWLLDWQQRMEFGNHVVPLVRQCVPVRELCALIVMEYCALKCDADVLDPFHLHAAATTATTATASSSSSSHSVDDPIYGSSAPPPVVVLLDNASSNPNRPDVVEQWVRSAPNLLTAHGILCVVATRSLQGFVAPSAQPLVSASGSLVATSPTTPHLDIRWFGLPVISFEESEWLLKEALRNSKFLPLIVLERLIADCGGHPLSLVILDRVLKFQSAKQYAAKRADPETLPWDLMPKTIYEDLLMAMRTETQGYHFLYETAKIIASHGSNQEDVLAVWRTTFSQDATANHLLQYIAATVPPASSSALQLDPRIACGEYVWSCASPPNAEHILPCVLPWVLALCVRLGPTVARASTDDLYALAESPVVSKDIVNWQLVCDLVQFAVPPLSPAAFHERWCRIATALEASSDRSLAPVTPRNPPEHLADALELYGRTFAALFALHRSRLSMLDTRVQANRQPKAKVAAASATAGD